MVVEGLRDAAGIMDAPFVGFADDDTFVNKRWGKQLLRAIAPMNLRWFTETDIPSSSFVIFLNLQKSTRM